MSTHAFQPDWLLWYDFAQVSRYGTDTLPVSRNQPRICARVAVVLCVATTVFNGTRVRLKRPFHLHMVYVRAHKIETNYYLRRLRRWLDLDDNVAFAAFFMFLFRFL
jgi:hypothetical protein